MLAVTGALFVSAAVLISGRQQQTQFNQAIREVRSQIQQVINETTIGYYPSSGNFSCQAPSSGPPEFTIAAAGQGTNEGCIFLGKAIHFGVEDTDPEQFTVMTIAGRQKNEQGQEVASLAEAQPRVVAPSEAAVPPPGDDDDDEDDDDDDPPSDPGPGPPGGPPGGGPPWWCPWCQPGTVFASSHDIPDTSISQPLLYGLSTVWADAGVVAFVNNLADVTSPVGSSVQQLNTIPVNDSWIGMDTDGAAHAVNTGLADSPQNPADGVRICFASGGTNQSGLITIGGAGQGLSVTLDIRSNTDCS